ncbi:MAG: tetratricopeptide repeat protein [Thermoanaerobaculia bacterium]|nr:tetratricopeptide repeat protein [Thermoanaerobaculia bacterium]
MTRPGEARAPIRLGYAGADVARLLDLPETRLRSWVRSGFLSPGRGPDGELRFTFQDLVVLRAAQELEAAGIPPRRIRRALGRLAEQLPGGRSLAAVRIAAAGSEIVVRDGTETWNPESGQRVFDFAVAEIAVRAAPLAHRAAERARASDDLSAEQWYGLGWELEATVPDEAERAYRRALELDPDHADARLNLGRLVHASGRLEEAEEAYLAALELRPGDPTALFDLGVVRQDRGRPWEAIEAYRQAVAADPGFADAYFNLASLYERLGKEPLAIQNLRRYRRLVGGRGRRG